MASVHPGPLAEHYLACRCEHRESPRDFGRVPVHCDNVRLGKFAEAFPGCVKRIAKEGHEIATHGHVHIQIFRQSATEFREDVCRAKCYLEDLLGQPVVGYRAPDFSITRQTLWAVEILAELGFLYDSSIFPIQHAHYGIPGWPLHPVRVKLESGQSIVELPIGTLLLAGRCWPVGGGEYHRLMPWPLIE